MRHWMFQCREVSRLVSEGMDRELSLPKRLGIRVHLMMCRWCSRNRRQMRFLRELAQAYRSVLEQGEAPAALPAEARARIQEALRKNGVRS